MNRRGKRLAFTVMATGLAVVSGLGILHWDTVRDHFRGWRFQLSTKTATILPNPIMKGLPAEWKGWIVNEEKSLLKLEDVLTFLGNHSGRPVVYDPSTLIDRNRRQAAVWLTDSPTPSTEYSLSPTDLSADTADLAMRILRANGWRVIEQRLPRRAYVIISDEHAPSTETLFLPFELLEGRASLQRRINAAKQNRLLKSKLSGGTQLQKEKAEPEPAASWPDLPFK
jgi:hypothetical protein